MPRENVRIFNVKEEVEDNNEELVRNLPETKLKIITLEKVKTRNEKPPNRPRPVIARFSHYQDKEFIQSFYKNLNRIIIIIIIIIITFIKRKFHKMFKCA